MTVTIATKFSLPFRAEGRLTSVTGQPLMYDSLLVPLQGGFGEHSPTLYYTPYKGQHLSLYDGGKWIDFVFDEFSISNAGLADSLLVANGPYDVFAYIDGGGLPALEFGTKYGQFMRPANRIQLQDGIEVKYGDPTRRLLGTIATVAQGNHTPPYLFWKGTNVNFIANRYNEEPFLGLGWEGMWGTPGSPSGFDLTADANGQWQIPLFLGANPANYSYPGHFAADGDGIYTNWVCCKPTMVRVSAKVKMLKGGCTKYGAGILINGGDDVYDATKIYKTATTTLDELNAVITTAFVCPPGVWGSFLGFFAEGGTKVAHVEVSDTPRGATGNVHAPYVPYTDPLLTYIEVEIAN
jgi:hypothetical protein